MYEINGFLFPDVITAKTPGTAMLRIFDHRGEELTKKYMIAKYDFAIKRAIIAEWHETKPNCVKMIPGTNKVAYKTAIFGKIKFSFNGNKPVEAKHILQPAECDCSAMADPSLGV